MSTTNCRNLRAEIARAGYTVKKFSDKIGINSQTFYGKINGRKFSIDEAKMIRDVLKELTGRAYTIEELFL